MKKELQNKLFKNYPKIFRQKDLSARETAMCWGISCGDGWYELIDDLCANIQNRVENVNRSRQHKIDSGPKTLVPTKYEPFVCEATQVKEKFGALCFYTCGGDDFIDGLISMAETMSVKICTECGKKAEVNKARRGWIYTYCKACKEKELNEE